MNDQFRTKKIFEQNYVTPSKLTIFQPKIALM
jgi:hypothetical protein